MIEYVLGFLFNNNNEVALISKNKPEWQKGKFNGIGGKIEKEENEYEAMIREFKEETGADVNEWNEFCRMEGTDWRVYVFKAFGDYTLKTMEEEKVIWYNGEIGEKCIYNLKWLIPMALDKNKIKVEVYYG